MSVANGVWRMLAPSASWPITWATTAWGEAAWLNSVEGAGGGGAAEGVEAFACGSLSKLANAGLVLCGWVVRAKAGAGSAEGAAGKAGAGAGASARCCPGAGAATPAAVGGREVCAIGVGEGDAGEGMVLIPPATPARGGINDSSA